MKTKTYAFGAVVLLSVAGCAHRIVISPTSAHIERGVTSLPKIRANVGYYIPARSMALEVTTPGGGGDNVRYFPYKDMEAAYQRMLSNVFGTVVKLQSLGDSDALSRSAIAYVLSPEVVTSSGSTGFFTWPPTTFTIDLTTKVTDTSGRLIGSPRVVGTGHVAGISEFRGDFALAGKLAVEDAMLKMQEALLAIPYAGTMRDNGESKGPAPQVSQPIKESLEQHKSLPDR